MVYKVNRQSLKVREKYWLGTKQGQVIPNKVAISEALANELSKHYYDLDQEKELLEAERAIISAVAEEKQLLLKRIEAEGPIIGIKFRNTVRGIGAGGEVVAIVETWEWQNQTVGPGEDLDPQKTDLIRLLSWEPDTYRPQDLSRERTVTPSEAETINKVLAEQGISVKQLEAEIKQLEGQVDHIGTQIAAVVEQLDLPLTLKEG